MSHIEKEKLIKADDCIDREYTAKYVEEFANNEYVSEHEAETIYFIAEGIRHIQSVIPKNDKPSGKWIPVSERLPDTDNENNINNYNVLLWVKNKSHPEREPQIYLGKLRHIDGDDGSGNIWGVEIKPCDWTIWGWSYFSEPEVLAWMPLPKPYEPQESEDKK